MSELAPISPDSIESTQYPHINEYDASHLDRDASLSEYPYTFRGPLSRVVETRYANAESYIQIYVQWMVRSIGRTWIMHKQPEAPQIDIELAGGLSGWMSWDGDRSTFNIPYIGSVKVHESGDHLDISRVEGYRPSLPSTAIPLPAPKVALP